MNKMELSLVVASNYASTLSDMVGIMARFSMEDKRNSYIESINRSKVNDKKFTSSDERHKTLAFMPSSN